jgi:hypothetical protein
MSLEEKDYFPQFELAEVILFTFYMVLHFVIYTFTQSN